MVAHIEQTGLDAAPIVALLTFLVAGAAAATVIFDAIKVPRGAVICGGEMIVDSMRWVGKGVEVILKGAGNASRAVVTLTADAAKATSLAVGQSIKVVAVGSGYVLTASGKALGYVPGEDDKDLVRSARSQ